MSGLETGLAILGAVDLLSKWVREVSRLCKDLKSAQRGLDDRLLRIDLCAIRLSAHLNLPRGVIDQMEADHQAVHLRLISKANEKLEQLYQELLTITQSVKVSTVEQGSAGEIVVQGHRRTWAKFARRKDKLDDAIAELESWLRGCDINSSIVAQLSHQLLIHGGKEETGQASSLVATGHDATSRKSASIPELLFPIDILKQLTAQPIPFSDAKLATRGADLVVLDELALSITSKWDASQVASVVRQLARDLRSNQTPHIGLFQIKGYTKEIDLGKKLLRATLIFKVPQTLTGPRSLRAALLDEPQLFSLTTKIQIAQELATSLSHIHLFGFVHKNIRPETILLFTEHKDAQWPLSTFLVGFEKFRKDAGMTSHLGDDLWNKNIYRYPRRYGSNPEDAYIMQHDIYSLGVCLLELGLGLSFVNYPYGKDKVIPSSHLNLPYEPNVQDLGATQQHLINLTERRLPQSMGSKYTAIVRTCLTCLDDQNDDFGDDTEFQDSDGILVGVRYIEKILVQLLAISV